MELTITTNNERIIKHLVELADLESTNLSLKVFNLVNVGPYPARGMTAAEIADHFHVDARDVSLVLGKPDGDGRGRLFLEPDGRYVPNWHHDDCLEEINGRSIRHRQIAEQMGLKLATSAREAEFGYQEGDRVWHPKFGEGIVVSSYPAASGAYAGDGLLTINFLNVGQKKVMLEYAPLDRIDPCGHDDCGYAGCKAKKSTAAA